MKNKKLFIVAFVLVVIIVIGFIVFNKSQPHKFAVINGWVFEIQTDQGIKNFMVRFGSWPGNAGKIINEEELIEFTKTGKWIPPFEKHSKEEWAQNCFFNNFEDCDYGYSENLMLNYLQDSGINGQIANAYIGYFKIACSGVTFPKATNP